MESYGSPGWMEGGSHPQRGEGSAGPGRAALTQMLEPWPPCGSVFLGGPRACTSGARGQTWPVGTVGRGQGDTSTLFCGRLSSWMPRPSGRGRRRGGRGWDSPRLGVLPADLSHCPGNPRGCSGQGLNPHRLLPQAEGDRCRGCPERQRESLSRCGIPTTHVCLCRQKVHWLRVLRGWLGGLPTCRVSASGGGPASCTSVFSAALCAGEDRCQDQEG